MGSAIAAGSVFRFSISCPSTGVPAVTLFPVNGTLAVNGWTSTAGPLTCPGAAGGENWFIYQGGSPNSFTGATFIYAWTNTFGAAYFSVDYPRGTFLTNPPHTTTNVSIGYTFLPPSLTNNTNAIALNRDPNNATSPGYHGDNSVYTGTLNGSKASLLTAIGTISNWLTHETTVHDISPGGSQFPVPFTVIGPATTITSLNRVNATPSNASTVNWMLTFAAANTGVTASNFSLGGAAATGASVGTPTTSNGGVTWNVPVTTGSTDGTLTLSLANATGTTPGVSTTLPFAGQSYTMDKTRPTVSIGAPSASSVAPGGSVTYTVTYADANFASSSLTTGGISLNTTGGANGTIGLSGSGTSYTVTISSITGAGTIGINVAAGTSLDTAGNANLVSAASTTFNVLSNNADLSALALTTATINESFSAATTAYTSSVPNGTSSVTVTATRAQANASLQVQLNGGGFSALTSGSPSGALALNVGANPIDVRVTAQDGTTIKTYTITVTRAAPADYAITTGAGVLTITDNAGNADTLAITEPSAGNILFTATGRSFSLNGAAVTTNNSGSISLSGITSIVVNAAAGADTVSVAAFTAASYAISVNGGADADTLSLAGSYSASIVDSNGSGAGTVTLDTTKVITFASVDAVDASAATIASLTATLDPTSVFAGDVITTIASADTGVNTLISFADNAGAPNGLASIKFGALTGTLTVQGDNVDNDFFDLKGLGSNMLGHFIVDGRGGSSDVVIVNATTFTVPGAGKNFSAKADFIGTGRVTVAAPADLPGIIECSGNITVEADGDSTIAVPPLFGAGGVWASVPITPVASAYLGTSLTGAPFLRGSILHRGVVRKTSGADATATFKARANLTFQNATPGAGTVTSTNNKLHTILWSDSDNSGEGNVACGAIATILTNGGDLTIGGGLNPATSPARGLASSPAGVGLAAVTINTSGGNISIRGQGAALVNGLGVAFTANNVLNPGSVQSGAGNFTVVGTGGVFAGTTTGVQIQGDTAGVTATTTLSTTTGALSITGTAGGGTSNGVNITSLVSVGSSSGGAVSITGTGAGTGFGFNIAPNATFTSTVQSTGGSITLIADKMNLNGGAGTESINAVNGSVRLMPRTGGVLVNLGSSVDTTASTLEISAAELDNINAGSIEVADGGLFPITVSAVIAPLNFKTLFLLSSTTFSATGGFASDVTSSSVFEQLVVFSTVSITSGATLTMSSAGGYIWNGTDTFRVIDNDAGDAITGTFTGPTLTNFLGSSLTAQQTYTGGTGNDLVFFAPPSSNADLSALVFNTATISPVFGAATTTYTASVSNSTSSVTVTPTRAHPAAGITVRISSNGGPFGPVTPVTSGSPSGALALSVGSNTIEVRVTAQDGTPKTYTVTVTRRSIIEDWRFDFFADASGTSTRANGADFDTDGKTNLLEFAFGTDPTLGSSGPPALTMTGTYAAATFGTTGQPIVKLEPITNGVDFRALFIRRIDHAAAGLTYTPEFSADDFSSFTASVAVPTVLATSGSYQLVSVPYPHFLSNGKKARYFRVTVNITP